MLPRRLTISLLLFILSVLPGCAEFGITNIVSVRNGEVQFRECHVTMWSALIVFGYRQDRCKESFLRYEGEAPKSGSPTAAPPSL
jgi:hypothetical protein